MSGRPIRFLGVILIGWTSLRAVMLWPVAGPEAIPHALVPSAFAENAPRSETHVSILTVPSPIKRAESRPVALSFQRAEQGVIAPANGNRTVEWQVQPAATIVAGPPPPATPQTLLAPPSALQRIGQPPLDHWSASAWFVLRDGRGIAPGLGGGQLGGSQTGLRVAYAIGDARRVALVGRVASPLKGRGREAAIGFEWRPTKLPVRFVAEYRVALDSGASGPAAGIIAGTGPAPLALGFDLETYGQAGVVRRHRDEPFAEGAARLARPIATLGGAKVDLGLGGWGGAQRGAQRLDIGPSLGTRVPIAGKAIRLSLDWRQRIVGNARPGSGPVLVIGGDF